jgi:hypothetical protein
MPILTYESDGFAVAPAFLRQVEVHIQQVLERAADNHEGCSAGLAARLTSAVSKWREDLVHTLPAERAKTEGLR